MKKGTDEDLDKLFKKGLEDPANEATFRETDWEAMEQLLDEGKKRPAIIFLLPWLSTAAAIVLVLLGWLIFRPHPAQNNENKGQSQIAVAPKQTGTSGAATRHGLADSSKQETPNSATYANNPVHHGEAKKTDRSSPYPPVGRAAGLPAGRAKGVSKEAIASNETAKFRARKDAGAAKDQKPPVAGGALAAVTNNPPRDKKNVATADDRKQTVEDNILAKSSSEKRDLGTANDKMNVGTADGKKQPVEGNVLATNSSEKRDLGTADDKMNVGRADGKKQISDANNIASTKVKMNSAGKSGLSGRPVYAISAIASSDMNSVGFEGGRLGGNFGAMFSMNIKKWTLTTGAMYSIKPYQENFASYHTNYVFTTNPSSIAVNCKMIDIPLNVNYQIFSEHNNKITVGTGLSSYIILREDYKFNYADTYAYGPSGYSVINKNRNILGVLNLDATFDHQINSKLGISLQPYVKLPFSNIGESQARLQSTGIAVGFSYNLNSFKKPN